MATVTLLKSTALNGVLTTTGTPAAGKVLTATSGAGAAWLALPAGPYYSAAANGWATGATAAVNDAALAAATTAARAAGLPLWLGVGLFHVSAAIDWTGGFLTANGAYGYTKIIQDTDTAAVAKLGGQRLILSGVTLRHAAAPSSTQGNGIETYALYQSHLSNIDIENTGTGFKHISSSFFSNLIEHVAITGWWTGGIYINNPGSTGSVFNNVYINNDTGSGSLPCVGIPVLLTGINDGVFNQLNIEHTVLGSSSAIQMQDCTNMTINGLHIEGVSHPGYGGKWIDVYGQTKVVINGLGILFSDVGPTGSGSGGRSLIRCSGGGRAIINNVHAQGNTNTTSQTGITVATTETGNGSIVWVNGGITADLFSAAPSGDVRAYGDPMPIKFAGPLTTTQLPQSGMFGLDTTNHRLYVNDGGTLRYATLT